MRTEELIGELRDSAPRPSERFAAELDERAANGFRTNGDARRTQAPGALARLRRRLAAVPSRRLIPAAGAVASLVIVVGIAVSQLSREAAQPGSLERESPPASSEGGGSAAGGQPQAIGPAPGSAAAGGGAASADEALRREGRLAPVPTPAPPIPGQPPLVPNAGRRQVERSAALTLSSDRDEVGAVADGVVEVTDRYRGFVVSSNVNDAGDNPRASFDLRIPTAKLQDAIADLSELAQVKSRNEGSLDITAPFISARERAEDARAEIDALLDRLADADSEAEIESIRARLRVARRALAFARSDLKRLGQCASLSAVTVSIVSEGDGEWTLGDAADDALSVLRALAGAALVTLAVLAPAALLAVLIWAIAGSARRRGRERALDGAE